MAGETIMVSPLAMTHSFITHGAGIVAGVIVLDGEMDGIMAGDGTMAGIMVGEIAIAGMVVGVVTTLIGQAITMATISVEEIII